MPVEVELKKSIRPNDLALKAGRQRQSKKTGFVHGTAMDSGAFEFISIYENMCFAMALFEKKTGDDVEEAKELLSKLLSFQVEEGNFPIFLHEFPNCFDPNLRLKIAPFLCRILSDFGQVLSKELKIRVEASLTRALNCAPHTSLWQFRKEVCLENKPEIPACSNFTLQEMWEHWISLEFLETPSTSFFHHGLKVYGGNPSKVAQEGFQTAPQLLEWMIEPDNRPIHPAMIFLSALKELASSPFTGDEWCLSSDDGRLILAAPTKQDTPAVKMIWQGEEILHSIAIDDPGKTTLLSSGFQTECILPNPAPISRTDLFESALFVDAHPEIDVSIEGVKGTVFRLDQEVWICLQGQTIRVRCDVVRGTGHFIGHIYRSNRRAHTKSEDFEAYDWKIGIRTVSRSDECALLWVVCF